MIRRAEFSPRWLMPGLFYFIKHYSSYSTIAGRVRKNGLNRSITHSLISVYIILTINQISHLNKPLSVPIAIIHYIKRPLSLYPLTHVPWSFCTLKSVPFAENIYSYLTKPPSLSSPQSRFLIP